LPEKKHTQRDSPLQRRQLTLNFDLSKKIQEGVGRSGVIDRKELGRSANRLGRLDMGGMVTATKEVDGYKMYYLEEKGGFKADDIKTGARGKKFVQHKSMGYLRKLAKDIPRHDSAKQEWLDKRNASTTRPKLDLMQNEDSHLPQSMMESSRGPVLRTEPGSPPKSPTKNMSVLIDRWLPHRKRPMPHITNLRNEGSTISDYDTARSLNVFACPAVIPSEPDQIIQSSHRNYAEKPSIFDKKNTDRPLRGNLPLAERQKCLKIQLSPISLNSNHNNYVSNFGGTIDDDPRMPGIRMAMPAKLLERFGHNNSAISTSKASSISVNNCSRLETNP
jgi:hypothetical protein